jgi:hypothetical protein
VSSCCLFVVVVVAVCYRSSCCENYEMVESREGMANSVQQCVLTVTVTVKRCEREEKTRSAVNRTAHSAVGFCYVYE